MVWVWRAYLYWAFFWFGLAMLVLAPFLVLPYYLLSKAKAAKYAWPFMRLWAASFIFPIGGINFKRIGSQPRHKAIYIANHNSYLDTPALAYCLPKEVRFLAKTDLAKFPVFGFVYKHLVIAVDRHNFRSRAFALQEMKAWLGANVSVLIFPEGKMNKTETLIQEFQIGAFQLAFETQLPIVPVVINGTRAALPATHFALRPTNISVKVLPFFLPSEFNSPAEMMTTVRQSMLAELETMAKH